MKELSLHVLDLAQNSIVAGAALLQIEIDEQDDRLTIILTDDGQGMDEEFAAQVTSPFVTTRTTRKVGLGIPMFLANAQNAGGGLTVESHKGKGTVLRAWFVLSHIDRPPMGDICGTWESLIIMNPAMDFLFTYRVGEAEFRFDTREVKEVLGDDVPIDNPDVAAWVRDSIFEGVGALGPVA